MVRLIAVLVVLVMAVSGCSKAVSGSAVPNAEAAKEAASLLTAKRALGEFASIDYCSLLDTTPLPADIGPVTTAPRPAYEYCLFQVRVSGFEADVQVGFLDNSDTIEGTERTEDRGKTPPRGLTIERGPDDSDECHRHLRFIDNIWLTISVGTVSVAGAQAGKGDWCRVADATIDVVIRRVLAKQVRHYSFADKSVGRLDACDLVPASVVNARVGIKDGTALRFPTGHACYWTGRASTDPIARLFLGHGNSTSDHNTKEEILAKRRSYVTPYYPHDNEYSLCDVETNHIDSPDLGYKELVVVEVALGGKDKDACAPARELAKEVWAKLPTP